MSEENIVFRENFLVFILKNDLRIFRFQTLKQFRVRTHLL
jgi:hypothetical protein